MNTLSGLNRRDLTMSGCGLWSCWSVTSFKSSICPGVVFFQTLIGHMMMNSGLTYRRRFVVYPREERCSCLLSSKFHHLSDSFLTKHSLFLFSTCALTDTKCQTFKTLAMYRRPLLFAHTDTLARRAGVAGYHPDASFPLLFPACCPGD